jgi:hypothetical protein
MQDVKEQKKKAQEFLQAILLATDVMRELAAAALVAVNEDRWDDAAFYLEQLSDRTDRMQTYAPPEARN